MLWLWNGPLPFVPPEGSRTVIGQGTLVRQYCVPALFKIWLSAMLEKSANCISTIGRIPSMAAPMAVPIIASSLIGVFSTRPGNCSARPFVALNAPPNFPAMSWP